MSNVIKLTDEELVQLNELKNDIQKTIFSLGELYLEKMELDSIIKTMSEKETELRNGMQSTKKKESEFIDKILDKYGEGSLNLADGVFIPTEK
jgi:hypothetical protein